MTNRYWLSFVLLLHCSSINGDLMTSILTREKEILDYLLNSSSYDIRVRPMETSDVTRPTKITVNLYVKMMSRIDDVRMQYNTQIILRQKWLDNRLKYDNVRGKLRHLNLFEEKIWTPDLYFANERSGYINSIMKPNKYIRIYPDGRVLYSARVSLVLSCPMDFRLFPFDTQICPMRFESYGFTDVDVVFEWEEFNPVGMPKDFNFAHYTMMKSENGIGHISLSTGSYSSLEVSFYLRRNLAHHLFHLFLPTMLLVVTSWITFWLDHQFPMTRLFTTLTTLLVLGYKVSDFNASLTPVSYIKSVDVWTGACVMFVFTALIEVVVVDYRWRQQQKRQRRAAGVLGTTEEENSTAIDLKPMVSRTSSNATETFQRPTQTGRAMTFFCRHMSSLPTGPTRLDVISRYLFPAAFTIFNVFFWLVNLICYAL